MKFFEIQNDEMHLSYAQVKSRIEAAKIKASNITINADGSYDIQGHGAEPYHASLTSCSCRDFQFNKKRQAPCKHIYRIAMDQNLIALPKMNPALKKEIDAQIPQELEKWTQAFLSGAIKPEKYVAIVEALTK